LVERQRGYANADHQNARVRFEIRFGRDEIACPKSTHPPILSQTSPAYADNKLLHYIILMPFCSASQAQPIVGCPQSEAANDRHPHPVRSIIARRAHAAHGARA
jgi:hypothetical protein